MLMITALVVDYCSSVTDRRIRAMTNGPVLHVEAEQQHVAVPDDVGLALDPHLTSLLGALLAAAGDVVVIGDGLAGDEAALEVLVDHGGGLGRAGALGDGPGVGFLGAAGEVGHQL